MTTNMTGTLADLAAAYIAHLENAGKSTGTLFSYSMELRTACAELGAETPLSDLTPDHVAAYYACDRVTKTRDGRPKASVSIAKTRRVLRLALEWAAKRRMMKAAPLRGTQRKSAKSKAKATRRDSRKLA